MRAGFETGFFATGVEAALRAAGFGTAAFVRLTFEADVFATARLAGRGLLVALAATLTTFFRTAVFAALPEVFTFFAGAFATFRDTLAFGDAFLAPRAERLAAFLATGATFADRRVRPAGEGFVGFRLAMGFSSLFPPVPTLTAHGK